MNPAEGCSRCEGLAKRRDDLGLVPACVWSNELSGEVRPKILIVLDGASGEEMSGGGPSVAEGSVMVSALCAEAGLVRADYAFTYAVRCPTEKGEKLSRSVIDACRPWLDAEVRGLSSVRVVVCMGNTAISSVLNVPLMKVSSVRDRVSEVRLGDDRVVRVISSVHPYQASISSYDREALLFDLRRAARMSEPDYAPFDMDRFSASVAGGYRLVTTAEDAHDMVETLLSSPMVAFDTETRRLDPWHLPPRPKDLDVLDREPGFLTSVQFSPGPARAYFVPIEHESLGGAGCLPEVKEELRRFFRTYDGMLAAFNAKFDQVAILHGLGVLPRVGIDPMVVDQLRSGLPARGLKTLAWEVSPYGGYEGGMFAVTETLDEDAGHDSYRYPIDTLFWYGGLDVDVTWRVARRQVDVLAEDKTLAFLSEYLCRASGALARIEVDGWRIDRGYLEEFGRMQEGRRLAAETAIRDLAPAEVASYERDRGVRFNPASAKALGFLLYDALGLVCPERTPKGAPSTSKSALQKLAGTNPVVDEVLKLRKAEKLKQAFYDRWTAGVASDGRLHFRYNLAKFRDDDGDMGGTESGRLSSSGPAGNVQQIPKDGEIRRVFLPDDDRSVLLDVDFTTLEYVVAAIHSGDPKLVDAFKNGYDIHAAVASELFGGTPEEMKLPENKKLRQRAKTLNFAILYGSGVGKIAEMLGVSRAEAEGFYDQYHERFPMLFKWVESVRRSCRRTGKCVSKFGRVRMLPDAKLPRGSRFGARLDAALRRGVNTPVQGDASDLCLWGLVRIQDEIDRNGWRARIKATIHDALVLSVPIEELSAVYSAVVNILTKPGLPWVDGPKSPGVPLRVSAAVGVRWGDLEEVE